MKIRVERGSILSHYHQIIIDLIYLTITQPDISYPIGVINQFMKKPTLEHLRRASEIAICEWHEGPETFIPTWYN